MGCCDPMNSMNSVKKVRDVVCGMEKPKDEFKFTSDYQGKTYYFCSKNCQEMFEGNPRGYVGK